MKIALCISGQMRTYRECYPNLYKFLLDPYSPDVFIHTWSEIGFTHKTKPRNRIYWSSQVEEIDLRSKYDPKYMIVEPFESEFINNLKGVRVPRILQQYEPVHYRGCLPMLYKIHACNAIKSKYMVENRICYDIVIRFRPDLMLHQKPPIHLAENTSKTLWHSSLQIDPEIQVSDKFAFGDSETMDYYSSAFEYLSEYWKNPLGKKSSWETHLVGERLMKHHMENSRFSVKLFDCESELCRGDIGQNNIVSNIISRLQRVFQ